MRNKIYIVDDEANIRQILAWAIADDFPQYEKNIVEFDNGKSAYESFKDNYDNVKLILTDNNMPEMNGLELIGKCSELCSEVPIIQMSAYDIAKEASDAGAVAFLGKPFKLEVLMDTLEKYL